MSLKINNDILYAWEITTSNHIGSNKKLLPYLVQIVQNAREDIKSYSEENISKILEICIAMKNVKNEPLLSKKNNI